MSAPFARPHARNFLLAVIIRVAAFTAPPLAASASTSTSKPSPIRSRLLVTRPVPSANGTTGCSIRTIRTDAVLTNIMDFAPATGAITSARRWSTMAGLYRARGFASTISQTKRWSLWRKQTRPTNRFSLICRTTRRTVRCRCRTAGGINLRTKKSRCTIAIPKRKTCRTYAARWQCVKTSTGMLDAFSKNWMN